MASRMITTAVAAFVLSSTVQHQPYPSDPAVMNETQEGLGLTGAAVRPDYISLCDDSFESRRLQRLYYRGDLFAPPPAGRLPQDVVRRMDL